MVNKLIWLYSKLFVSIDRPTCIVLGRYGYIQDYKGFFSKHGLLTVNWDYKYPEKYKQLRREMMYRFLVRGER